MLREDGAGAAERAKALRDGPALASGHGACLAREALCAGSARERAPDARAGEQLLYLGRGLWHNL